MKSLKQTIMERDGLSDKEATEMIADARRRVYAGEDPEEILLDEFSLESDYIFDLIDL